MVPSADAEMRRSCFLAGGRWQEPRAFSLSEDATVLENAPWIGACASCARAFRRARARLEHLAILVRWHGSSWRDGEWIGFDSFEKIPYRKTRERDRAGGGAAVRTATLSASR